MVGYCNNFDLIVFDPINEAEGISWEHVPPSTHFELRPTVRGFNYSAEDEI